MSYDRAPTFSLEELRAMPVDQEREEECDYGWIAVTELLSDGRIGGEWYHTERYLYYSPSEVVERFTEMLTEKGWKLCR